ncbi:MAG: DEAD/DEAH box helicase [Opitutales bacterium]
MELYVPEVNFASLYPEWSRWDGSNYKAIATTNKHKEAGAMFFVDGCVSELRPLPERPGFEACVTDGKAYGVSVWLTDDPRAPGFECGCAEGRADTPCSHVMALLAALVYLFHEQNFLPLSPLLGNVNQLAAAIDDSKKSGRKNLNRIRLRSCDAKRPYIEGNIRLPQNLVEAINPYREISRMARNTLELPTGDLREPMRKLVDYARKKKIALEAEDPHDGFVKLAAETATIDERLRFVAAKRGVVRIESAWDTGGPGAVMAYPDCGVVVLREGRIALLDETKFQRVRDAFHRKVHGFADLYRKSDGLERQTFNAFSARLDHDTRRLLRQCEFAHARDDGSEPVDPESAETLVLQARVRIDSWGSESPQQHAFLEGTAGRDFVPLGFLFSEFMNRLCDHARAADRLLGSRKRVDALLVAAARLPGIGTQAERRKYINSVCAMSDFHNEEHAAAAREFLRDIERDYCRPKSAVTRMLVCDTAEDTYAWRSVRLPLPGLLTLTAALYRHTAIQELPSSECDPLPLRMNGDAPGEIAELCESLEIPLLINDRPTVVRHTEIAVDCVEGDKEDWFELKPSVRCEGAEIPPEQWTKLLQGTLLLESDDGGYIAPRVKRNEALKPLVEAFGENNNAVRGTQIQRLQLLDWIAWRKQGLEVRMPAKVETLLHNLLNFDGIPEVAPPSSLRAEMRPYQRRGFEWLVFLYRHRCGACLADDMGLGKTLQALAFLDHIRAESSEEAPLRVLAVLPPSLLFNWENEAARFTPDLRVETYAGAGRNPAVLDNADLVLTTYDIVRRDIGILEKHRFEVTLFDEVQALKNHTSRRSRAARRLARRFTVCLTGTPMENHAGEYHAIMDLALPGLMGERKAFVQALKDGDDTALRRARPFLLRRTKDAILRELPPKVESDIPLEMNDEQREIYTRLVGEIREEVLSAYQKQTRAQAGITALAALTRLRQLCVSPALLGHELGHVEPKIAYLVETLAELREEGHAVLVFSQFVKALDRIEAALRAEGAAPLRLDGGTPAADRKAVVERFQTSPEPEVFLVSLRAGGVGLNLTRASYVIHVDPWWNPSVENQASDRAHRIGQEQTVFVQRLHMRDSVEEKIMALKARKRKLFDAIVGDKTSDREGAPGITREDFQFLLDDY